MKYEVIDRQQFIDARYERFKAAKPMLEANKEIIYFTDLDEDYGDGLMKDMVLCDRCNEDIKEPTFIMLEGEYVYHVACVKSELPADMNFQNVTIADFKKQEG